MYRECFLCSEPLSCLNNHYPPGGYQQRLASPRGAGLNVVCVMQLEAFRRQKAEKKQPKAALPDEIPGKADELSKSTGAPSQPLSSPVKHASEVSEHQSQSRRQPSQDSLLSQPEDRTALRAVGYTDLTKHDKASSAQLPSDEAPPGDGKSAPDEAVQAERDTPAARPRTARNLFSAGHPAPPPLPLPPTPNSRYCLILRL